MDGIYSHQYRFKKGQVSKCRLRREYRDAEGYEKAGGKRVRYGNRKSSQKVDGEPKESSVGRPGKRRKVQEGRRSQEYPMPERSDKTGPEKWQ